MKQILTAVALILITALMSCNTSTEPNEISITNFSEGDTLSVGQDSAVTFRVTVKSYPAIPSEAIIPTVYYDSQRIPSDQVSAQVTAYNGYETDPIATVVVFANTSSTIGEYELRVVSSNGIQQDSVIYVLNIH